MVLPSFSCARHTSNVPRASTNVGHKHLFLLLFLVKTTLLAQTQVETLTINTSLPHLEFLVQNCGSSKGRQLWSFGRVSIFSLIF
ncbi:hypothetical protein MtrunA17_Chr6g0468741 [Medicago truncatula]|uniref:Transmembrane protein n=1 Tax=Medicago truncatula TaxID=3880 RepID=A0A396HJK4_MEDTR|nr:hypothetical protein MtrunA17_Chr6g0468741 [Medicago truncatula]